jgi:hypothetical protein
VPPTLLARADEVRSTRRLPLRGAEDRTWTLSGGRPPAFNRAAMASAARKLSPTELVVFDLDQLLVDLAESEAA